MKRFFVLLGTLLILSPAFAQSLPLVPKHQGYAFDRPRILALQRLFGLAHGVTLLAAACLADGAATKSRETLLLAYADWDKSQSTTIGEAELTLSTYFFGERAAEAKWSDIAAATGLRKNLDLKPGSIEMIAACDSLPATLGKPRYDLHRQYELQKLASRLANATAIEVQAETCQSQLSDESRAALAEARARWRDVYGFSITEAKTTLEQHWPDAQLEGSLDGWLAVAREKGKRLAKSDAIASDATPNCGTMSTWLATHYADPDDEFKPKP